MKLLDIIEFIELQTRLVNQFRISFPEVKDLNYLLDCPKTGVIYLNEEKWSFQRHGAGLEFKLNSLGTIVDVHKWLLHPEYFDEWRLEEYFSTNPNYSRVNLDMTKTIKVFICNGDISKVDNLPGCYVVV